MNKNFIEQCKDVLIVNLMVISIIIEAKLIIELIDIIV